MHRLGHKMCWAVNRRSSFPTAPPCMDIPGPYQELTPLAPNSSACLNTTVITYLPMYGESLHPITTAISSDDWPTPLPPFTTRVLSWVGCRYQVVYNMDIRLQLIILKHHC
ncbi:hypothetical protein XELAEV_18041942mg [Xenopus laevis]|uniref:Uncharacterized protein n=1 Tax=Xenopus laevis TaxID=8355 RepID=A0A974H622_XENLA|nr:hypothetical protein XELAEV_18041942mg [Xenopus laevis]